MTGVNGAYSITARLASITPNAASKVYGAADPTLTGSTSGFLPADNIVVTYSRTAGQSVAGSPYTISGTVTPNAALANYTVIYNTAAFTITRIAASVTPNAASKTYGSADPVLTSTLSGFLPAGGVHHQQGDTYGNVGDAYSDHVRKRTERYTAQCDGKCSRNFSLHSRFWNAGRRSAVAECSVYTQ